MDGFGDNFDQADVDPAAEFLAREKDQLAGLGDDVIPAASESNASDGAPANSGKYRTTTIKTFHSRVLNTQWTLRFSNSIPMLAMVMIERNHFRDIFCVQRINSIIFMWNVVLFFLL